MKHFVEFKMEDGGTIIVEVDEPETGGTTRASLRPGEIAEKPKETFEQALSKVRPATEKVITTLRELAHKLNEIEMEFGFSLNAEAGVVIDSASTAANYKVTLRWKGGTSDEKQSF
ncbi:MAG: CU044_2847 family protein [Ktedonobacteraceae bacterium]